MKIVVFTKKYGYNFTGATVATHELVHRWAAYPEVKRVDVLAKITGDFDPDPKIRVHRFGMKNPFPLICHFAGNGTVFYSDDHTGGTLASCGVPYIHTYHGNWPDARYLNAEYFLKSFYFMPRYEKTLRNAACVVNVSHYMESYTDRYNRNSVVIRNGTASDGGRPGENRRGGRRCVMIGTIDARKYGKLPELIRSLDRKKIPCTIDICGAEADRKLVSFLRQSDRVTIKGYVKRGDIDLGGYDLFLSTSTRENLPISIVEALKERVPVIALDAGGIREVVNDTCGRVVPKNRVREMADAIGESLDGSIRYSFENPVLDEFDWDRAAEKYMELFRKFRDASREGRSGRSR